MKYLLILIAMLALYGCAQTATIVPLVSEMPETKGMNKVNNSGFDSFFVNKDKLTRKYDGINFSKLDLDDVEIDNTRLQFPNREWVLSSKDKKRWQKIFEKSIKNAFDEKSEFKRSNITDKKILSADFKIVEFTPSATDEIRSKSYVNRVYTQSVGLISTQAIIRDSLTGENIVVMNDKREIDDRISKLERNNIVNNSQRLRTEWTSMLNQLERVLSQIQKD